MHRASFAALVEVDFQGLGEIQYLEAFRGHAARIDRLEVSADRSRAPSTACRDIGTAEDPGPIEWLTRVSFDVAFSHIEWMHDGRGTGIVRDRVGRRRIGDGNVLADTLKVRRHVGRMPSGRPARVEHLIRVGLEQHAIEHGIAAQPDSLIGERDLSELVRCAQRLERHQRILAGYVENGKVGASGWNPRRKGVATDRRAGRSARFDYEYALFSAARELELGSYDHASGTTTYYDRIIIAKRLIDALGASTSGQTCQRSSHADGQT